MDIATDEQLSKHVLMQLTNAVQQRFHSHGAFLPLKGLGRLVSAFPL